jgi:uncharacterized membrane protein YgcG
MTLIFIAIMMVIIVVGGYYVHRFVRSELKRTQDQQAERERFLEEFSDTLSAPEIEMYKKLPNHSARIAWLKENHSEFIEKMPYSIIEFKTAQCLDVKLLRNDAIWNEAELLQRYLDYCENISLSSYQEDLDAFALWIEKNVKQGLNREKASIELWESLNEENRRRFKQARKSSERKKILSEDSSDSSSTYQTDYLYPLMLTTYLGVDSSDSSYFDGGSFDTGSDSSGGDSGGGDGGGGGGD